jgi:predicted RNase H-like nuclease
MSNRERRSVNQFKTNLEKADDIMSQIEVIKNTNSLRYANIREKQLRMAVISENLDESLKKQEQNLDKLIKLSMAW